MFSNHENHENHYNTILNEMDLYVRLDSYGKPAPKTPQAAAKQAQDSIRRYFAQNWR